MYNRVFVQLPENAGGFPAIADREARVPYAASSVGPISHGMGAGPTYRAPPNDKRVAFGRPQTNRWCDSVPQSVQAEGWGEVWGEPEGGFPQHGRRELVAHEELQAADYRGVRVQNLPRPLGDYNVCVFVTNSFPARTAVENFWQFSPWFIFLVGKCWTNP